MTTRETKHTPKLTLEDRLTIRNDEIDRLKAENAELVKALEIIVNSEPLETGTFVCDFSSLQSVARAALAKART